MCILEARILTLDGFLESLVGLLVVLGQQAACGGSAPGPCPSGVRPATLINFLLWLLCVWVVKYRFLKGAVPSARSLLHLNERLLAYFNPVKILKVHVAKASCVSILILRFLLLLGKEATCDS
jgi:hypothetical protein